MQMQAPGPLGMVNSVFGSVVGTARTTVGWAVDSVIAVVTVPGRVLALFAAAESLVDRIDYVVNRADDLLRRTGRVLDETESLLDRAGTVASAADGLVDGARRTSAAAEALVGDVGRVTDKAAGIVTTAGHSARSAHELLEAYQPLARRALPMAQRFVEELSPHEIEAAIRLVDELPVLTEHIISDILPILATLDRVGPDIHQLLEVANDVRQAILGIPGFNFLRRRGEDKYPDPPAGNGGQSSS